MTLDLEHVLTGFNGKPLDHEGAPLTVRRAILLALQHGPGMLGAALPYTMKAHRLGKRAADDVATELSIGTDQVTMIRDCAHKVLKTDSFGALVDVIDPDYDAGEGKEP